VSTESVPSAAVLTKPALERFANLVIQAEGAVNKVVEALLNWLRPLQVLLLARRVDEAAVTVMSAVPLKDTPLMERAVWSWVAVPAFPPMFKVEVDT
jgi:hypothetical protein